jgi:hypothetical protein
MTKDDSPKLLYDPLKIERPESIELPKTVDEAVKIAQSNAGLDVLTLSWLILRLM